MFCVLHYILISSRFWLSFKDVCAVRRPDYGSDHYLVHARVQLWLHWAKRRAPPPTKLTWTCLRKPYSNKNSSALSSILEWFVWCRGRRKAAIGDHSRISRPSVPIHLQPWISVQCVELVDKRKIAKYVDFEQYQQLKKYIRCYEKPTGTLSQLT